MPEGSPKKNETKRSKELAVLILSILPTKEDGGITAVQIAKETKLNITSVRDTLEKLREKQKVLFHLDFSSKTKNTGNQRLWYITPEQN